MRIMYHKAILLLAIVLPAQLPAASSITVYSDGFGLVTETRRMEFERGVQEMLFDGVSQQIEPSSVLFGCEGVRMLEQNYEYDLVDARALMRRYLGRELDVVLEEGEVLRGRLLSAENEMVLDTGEGIVSLKPAGLRSVRYPELPEGLRLKPALRWLLDAGRSGGREISISYVTKGMGWQAEYVCLLNEEDTAMELAAWVQLSNRTGITWKDAGLQLVAGELHRAPEPSRRYKRGMPEMALAADGAGFEEEGFFEYHLYTLGRPVELKDQQDKQVALFDPVQVALEKLYVYESNRGSRGVQVRLEFVNSEGRGPDKPLPAGKFRLYKLDSGQRRQLIGEDRIEHTPVDEKVELNVGQAFDLVVERTVIDERRSGKTRDLEVEYKVRNRKQDQAARIQVREHVWGDWRVLHCDLPWEKLDARRIEIPVELEAGSERSFSLRLRTQ